MTSFLFTSGVTNLYFFKHWVYSSKKEATSVSIMTPSIVALNIAILSIMSLSITIKTTEHSIMT